MLFHEIAEIRLRLVNDDARCARLGVRDAVLFKQRDVYAGSGEDVRGCASDGAAADNRNLGV